MKIMLLEHDGWDDDCWDKVIGFCSDDESAAKLQKLFNVSAEMHDGKKCAEIAKTLSGFRLANHIMWELEDDPKNFHIECVPAVDLTEKCWLLT